VLGAGPYVFPVYGPVWFGDTYGARQADATWHHGDDIFAPLGAPVLAVANGTLFVVGWNQVGGNRLWLRDDAGNYFYYAHLAAFSTAAVEGARVTAGTIIGFTGDSGDARGTPPHLHFEIHPVSTIAFGYDGAVNPTSYLRAWQRLARLRLSNDDLLLTNATGWSAAVAAPTAPAPGAILVHSPDISTAAGLDKKAVKRALAPKPPPDRSWALRKALARRRAKLPVFKLTPLQKRRALRAENLDEEASLPPGFPGMSVWDALAQCEASGDWALNDGSGFYGGLQFTPETWRANGGTAFAPFANQATREQQIAIAERVLQTQGWIAWPVCSQKLGLR
jgi:Transglycosylase-like domain/Peptidase family M23